MQVFLLRNCEHLFVLQKTDVSNFLLGLKLGYKFLSLPFDHGQVSLAATKKDVFSVFSHIEAVIRAEVLQGKVEDVVGCLNRQVFFQLSLSYFQRALAFSLYFNETPILSVEQVVLFRESCLGFFLQNARLL